MFYKKCSTVCTVMLNVVAMTMALRVSLSVELYDATYYICNLMLVCNIVLLRVAKVANCSLKLYSMPIIFQELYQLQLKRIARREVWLDILEH